MRITDMTRSLAQFWWIGLAAAWAVDFLFWRKAPGISFLIWILLATGGGLWLAKRTGVRMAGVNLVLLGVMILSGGILFLRQEPFTRVVNVLLTLEIFVLAAATFSNGYWLAYRMVDFIGSNLRVAIAALVRPVEVIFARPVEGEGLGEEKKTSQRQAIPILRGLLLALPVVILLASLLSSADPIFNQQIQQILKIFDLDRLGEYIFRLFYVLILAYLFTGVYLHAVLPKNPASRPETKKAWFNPFLGSTETTVILGCVNLLFMVFVAIQFRYFFGGEINISETGYTFSEYARRGFGELVAVAVISLILYICLGLITRMEKQSEKSWFMVLVAILFALVMVILVSAFQRLLIYENAYGFTRLRTYTFVFIPWLAFLLLVTVVIEVAKQRSAFALALMAITIGFTLSIGLINIDGLIVQMNIQRARNGSVLDTTYLRELSTDAVPAMVKEYNAGGLLTEDRNTLGAFLACRAAETNQIPGKMAQPWQSFNVADLRAKIILGQMQNQLAAYPVHHDSGVWYVEVNGVEEACRPQNK
jgi:hypothetical protein